MVVSWASEAVQGWSWGLRAAGWRLKLEAEGWRLESLDGRVLDATGFDFFVSRKFPKVSLEVLGRGSSQLWNSGRRALGEAWDDFLLEVFFCQVWSFSVLPKV